MVELVVRLVFSLAVVLGMLILLTRLSARKFRGGADALVRVVHRQALSRTSAVAVVTVGSRVLVLGTTEHQVQLLTELDPEELELPAVAALPGSASADDGLSQPTEPSEPSEPSEFATLDELLGAPRDQSRTSLELVAPAYFPQHAAVVRAPAATHPTLALRRNGAVARATTAAQATDGALAGSLLSAQTWKQAFAAATNRARDAS